MKIVLATMTGIVLSLLPVAASPLLGQYLATDGAPVRPEIEAPLSAPRVVHCDCPVNATSYTFTKHFADTYSPVCGDQSSNGFRDGTWTSIKTVCLHGNIWACSADETSFCAAYVARPTCPQDTCAL